jgi:predicted DsbA family dithiol-disulfide isomerase
VQRFVQRFGGSAERAAAFQQRLRNMGAQEGIEFSFAGKIGSTRDSHRLIQLGKVKGGIAWSGWEDRVVMELFRDYFEGAGDITSHDTLVRVGVKAGMDGDEVRAWLEAGQGGAEVDAQVREAKSKGIRGVPHYTIQGRYEVDGAQDPQDFIEVFAKLKSEE